MSTTQDRRISTPAELPWMERGNVLHRLLRCFAADKDFQVEFRSLYMKHEQVFSRRRLLEEIEVDRRWAKGSEELGPGGRFVSSMSFEQLVDVANDNLERRNFGLPSGESVIPDTRPESLEEYIRDVLRLAYRWELGRLISEFDVPNVYTTYDDPRLPKWLEYRLDLYELDKSRFSTSAHWAMPANVTYVGIEAIHACFLECRSGPLVVRNNIEKLVEERFGQATHSGGPAPYLPLSFETGVISISLNVQWNFFTELFNEAADRARSEFEAQLAAEQARIVNELESFGWAFRDTTHAFEAHIAWTYRRLRREQVGLIAEQSAVTSSAVSRSTNRIAKLLGFKFPSAGRVKM